MDSITKRMRDSLARSLASHFGENRFAIEQVGGPEWQVRFPIPGRNEEGEEIFRHGIHTFLMDTENQMFSSSSKVPVGRIGQSQADAFAERIYQMSRGKTSYEVSQTDPYYTPPRPGVHGSVPQGGPNFPEYTELIRGLRKAEGDLAFDALNSGNDWVEKVSSQHPRAMALGKPLASSSHIVPDASRLVNAMSGIYEDASGNIVNQFRTFDKQRMSINRDASSMMFIHGGYKGQVFGNRQFDLLPTTVIPGLPEGHGNVMVTSGFANQFSLRTGLHKHHDIDPGQLQDLELFTPDNQLRQGNKITFGRLGQKELSVEGYFADRTQFVDAYLDLPYNEVGLNEIKRRAPGVYGKLNRTQLQQLQAGPSPIWTQNDPFFGARNEVNNLLREEGVAMRMLGGNRGKIHGQTGEARPIVAVQGLSETDFVSGLALSGGNLGFKAEAAVFDMPEQLRGIAREGVLAGNFEGIKQLGNSLVQSIAAAPARGFSGTSYLRERFGIEPERYGYFADIGQGGQVFPRKTGIYNDKSQAVIDAGIELAKEMHTPQGQALLRKAGVLQSVELPPTEVGFQAVHNYWATDDQGKVIPNKPRAGLNIAHNAERGTYTVSGKVDAYNLMGSGVGVMRTIMPNNTNPTSLPVWQSYQALNQRDPQAVAMMMRSAEANVQPLHSLLAARMNVAKGDRDMQMIDSWEAVQEKALALYAADKGSVREGEKAPTGYISDALSKMYKRDVDLGLKTPEGIQRYPSPDAIKRLSTVNFGEEEKAAIVNALYNDIETRATSYDNPEDRQKAIAASGKRYTQQLDKGMINSDAFRKDLAFASLRDTKKYMVDQKPWMKPGEVLLSDIPEHREILGRHGVNLDKLRDNVAFVDPVWTAANQTMDADKDFLTAFKIMNDDGSFNRAVFQRNPTTGPGNYLSGYTPGDKRVTGGDAQRQILRETLQNIGATPDQISLSMAKPITEGWADVGQARFGRQDSEFAHITKSRDRLEAMQATLPNEAGGIPGAVLKAADRAGTVGTYKGDLSSAMVGARSQVSMGLTFNAIHRTLFGAFTDATDNQGGQLVQPEEINDMWRQMRTVHEQSIDVSSADPEKNTRYFSMFTTRMGGAGNQTVLPYRNRSIADSNTQIREHVMNTIREMGKAGLDPAVMVPGLRQRGQPIDRQRERAAMDYIRGMKSWDAGQIDERWRKNILDRMYGPKDMLTEHDKSVRQSLMGDWVVGAGINTAMDQLMTSDKAQRAEVVKRGGFSDENEAWDWLANFSAQNPGAAKAAEGMWGFTQMTGNNPSYRHENYKQVQSIAAGLLSMPTPTGAQARSSVGYLENYVSSNDPVRRVLQGRTLRGGNWQPRGQNTPSIVDDAQGAWASVSPLNFGGTPAPGESKPATAVQANEEISRATEQAQRDALLAEGKRVVTQGVAGHRGRNWLKYSNDELEEYGALYGVPPAAGGGSGSGGGGKPPVAQATPPADPGDDGNNNGMTPGQKLLNRLTSANAGMTPARTINNARAMSAFGVASGAGAAGQYLAAKTARRINAMSAAGMMPDATSWMVDYDPETEGITMRSFGKKDYSTMGDGETPLDAYAGRSSKLADHTKKLSDSFEELIELAKAKGSADEEVIARTKELGKEIKQVNQRFKDIDAKRYYAPKGSDQAEILDEMVGQARKGKHLKEEFDFWETGQSVDRLVGDGSGRGGGGGLWNRLFGSKGGNRGMFSSPNVMSAAMGLEGVGWLMFANQRVRSTMIGPMEQDIAYYQNVRGAMAGYNADAFGGIYHEEGLVDRNRRRFYNSRSDYIAGRNLEGMEAFGHRLYGSMTTTGQQGMIQTGLHGGAALTGYLMQAGLWTAIGGTAISKMGAAGAALGIANPLAAGGALAGLGGTLSAAAGPLALGAAGLGGLAFAATEYGRWQRGDSPRTEAIYNQIGKWKNAAVEAIAENIPDPLTTTGGFIENARNATEPFLVYGASQAMQLPLVGDHVAGLVGRMVGPSEAQESVPRDVRSRLKDVFHAGGTYNWGDLREGMLQKNESALIDRLEGMGYRPNFRTIENAVDFYGSKSGGEMEQTTRYLRTLNQITGIDHLTMSNPFDRFDYDFTSFFLRAAADENMDPSQFAADALQTTPTAGASLLTREGQQAVLHYRQNYSRSQNTLAMMGEDAISPYKTRMNMSGLGLDQRHQFTRGIGKMFAESGTLGSTVMELLMPTSEYGYNLSVANGITNGPMTMNLDTFLPSNWQALQNNYQAQMGLRLRQQEWNWGFQERSNQASFGHQLTMFDISERQSQTSYENSVENIGRSQSQASRNFQMQMAERGIQRQQMMLNLNYQGENLSIGRERQVESRIWQDEDFEYASETAGLQFEWGQEDATRNIRLSRGRQKRQLIRQRHRQQVMYSMQEGQRDRQLDRREQQRDWEDEDFQRKKEHFEESKRLQIDLFDMQTGHAHERQAMQMENFEVQKEQLEEMRKLEKESFTERERRMHEEQSLWLEQFEKQKEFWKESYRLDLQRYVLTKTQEQAVANMKKITTEWNNVVLQEALEKIKTMASELGVQIDLIIDDIIPELVNDPTFIAAVTGAVQADASTGGSVNP